MPETVIRPTIKFIRAGYFATGAVVLGAIVAAFVYGPPEPRWLPAVALILFLWPLNRHIRRLSTRTTISGDRLRYESGLMSKATRTIQVSKIQDVRVDQSIAQRMFGVGNLSIETAGETSRLTLFHIDSPQQMADMIMDIASQKGTVSGT